MRAENTRKPTPELPNLTMKIALSALFIAALIYLVILAGLFLFQRSLIYFPTDIDPAFKAEEIVIESDNLKLRGWVINPGQAKALIYFGGNSELITANRSLFDAYWQHYSIYLVNYRGYGRSQGSPTEAGMFADALAIYDQIAPGHQSILAYGRSLGSGVAVYLATKRKLAKLILITPYDSVAAVAAGIYPIFPVRWLLKDQFDSLARADQIEIPVLIVTAQKDRVIPVTHSVLLKAGLVGAQVSYHMIANAAHNDVVDYGEFRQILAAFVED
ncbi:MAG: pimeloyl-ACP methyl ester carboxylesterase [Planctomycetota bacterium]|jgi:pimeloyl-ACP methyl ester carboxylesterase